jgi:hypothetical protein
MILEKLQENFKDHKIEIKQNDNNKEEFHVYIDEKYSGIKYTKKAVNDLQKFHNTLDVLIDCLIFEIKKSLE